MRSLVALFLSCFVSLAHAQLTIEITQGVDNPTKIAVVPMGNSGEPLPEDVSAIVAADLKRSGQFAPVPRTSMLSFPSSDEEVYYRDWRIMGTQYLLIGRIEQREGRYHATYSLYDVLGQRIIINRATVDGNTNQLRDIAHHIADKVYEKITGIRGAFSTEILYIEAFDNPGEQNDRYRLMLADADGARPQQLLESDQPLLSPAWGPEGRRIAYVSFETTRPAIFLQNLATGEREQLTNFEGLNGAPAFSPDGNRLAMVLSKDGNPEIYTLDLRSRRFTQITNHYAIDTEPSWTADGKGIVFTSNRGGQPQIYKVTLASGRVERLTFVGDYNASGLVSRDGKTLVMVHQSNGVFNIATQNLETGTLRILTETNLDESPTIAPNGAMLLYATRFGGKGILAAVSLDAGTKYRLPSKRGDVREPAWSPFFD